MDLRLGAFIDEKTLGLIIVTIRNRYHRIVTEAPSFGLEFNSFQAWRCPYPRFDSWGSRRDNRR